MMMTVAAVGGLLTMQAPAEAGCGCDKPAPARAAVRPFVGHQGERITLFSTKFVEGENYKVEFASLDTGVSDWSAGKARVKKDLADAEPRVQLTVGIPDVPFGPVRITVVNRAGVVMQLPDSAFTVTTDPLALHDFAESITRPGFQAGVSRDGTLYIPVDVTDVRNATSFVAQGLGYQLAFGPADVTMYNEQGFLMQRLDPNDPTLFHIKNGGAEGNSDALAYWRHEFRTYQQEHRRVRDRYLSDDPAWHDDGTRHVDHDHIVVAIRGTLPDGSMPVPGSTPPFTLVLTSTPDER